MTIVKNKDLECQVVARSGKIVLLFSRRKPNGDRVASKTDNFDLPVKDAAKFAQLVTDLAFEEDTGLKPASETLKAELIERHRTTLTQRVAVMLGTIREDKRLSNGKVAQDIVEACLREIFN